MINEDSAGEAQWGKADRPSCSPGVKEGRLGGRAAEKRGEDRKSHSGCQITTEEGVRSGCLGMHGLGVRAWFDLLKILDFAPQVIGSLYEGERHVKICILKLSLWHLQLHLFEISSPIGGSVSLLCVIWK